MGSPCLAGDGQMPFIRRGDNNVSEPSSMLGNNVVRCLDHGVGGCARSTPRNLPEARQVENPSVGRPFSDLRSSPCRPFFPLKAVKLYLQSRSVISAVPSGVHPAGNASVNGVSVTSFPSLVTTSTSDTRFERPKPPLPPGLPHPVRTQAIILPLGLGIGL
jgi:hypothetical protein